MLSPHIDLHRGGTAFAWAYKRVVEESDADLFVIFGTAHNPMRNLFSVTRKHFHTPLGMIETDRGFVSQLVAAVAAARGAELNLLADELAHRREHSIEFQVVFLQYLLGNRRPFKIVPVLTGSFHEFVAQKTSPADSPQVSAFVTAMRQTAVRDKGRICYISGGDLAHIGQRFGDREFLSAERLKDQAANDRQLLDAACRCDPEAFFSHVAGQDDRHRICGLSPTYTMLEVMRPTRGEMLRYDQAVELDGTSCVSFASLAFYDTPWCRRRPDDHGARRPVLAAFPAGPFALKSGLCSPHLVATIQGMVVCGERPKIHIIGMGDDGLEGVIVPARQLVDQADLLIGPEATLSEIRPVARADGRGQQSGRTVRRIAAAGKTRGGAGLRRSAVLRRGPLSVREAGQRSL